MSRHAPNVIGRPRARAALVTALLASAGAAFVPVAPAGAQAGTEAASRAPILTVTDATIERCGPVAITGTDFAPDAAVTISVNGTTEEKRPATDASGTFTFTTEVECEQTSGFLKIQASDGVTTVPIDLTVAARPEPIPQGPSAATLEPAAADGLAWWIARFVLAGVVVAELVVLRRRQQRRRARRARHDEAVDVTAAPGSTPSP